MYVSIYGDHSSLQPLVSVFTYNQTYYLRSTVIFLAVLTLFSLVFFQQKNTGPPYFTALRKIPVARIFPILPTTTRFFDWRLSPGVGFSHIRGHL